MHRLVLVVSLKGSAALEPGASGFRCQNVRAPKFRLCRCQMAKTVRVIGWKFASDRVAHIPMGTHSSISEVSVITDINVWWEGETVLKVGTTSLKTCKYSIHTPKTRSEGEGYMYAKVATRILLASKLRFRNHRVHFFIKALTMCGNVQVLLRVPHRL
jgi:hypothetical protein